MKTKQYAQILDRAAANKVPDSTDLTPRILAQIAAERSIPMQPKMRLATVILLVFLTLVLISTVAYAVYRLMGDPGLQSVQDAGLITGVDVIAQPTVLPTQTPERTPPPAGDLENAQTLQGVTLALDWVYLDETRLALGVNFTDLPEGAMLGAPVITFKGITPQGTQTFSQSVRADENRSVYVSYQVIHADVIGGKVDVIMDVPLLRQEGEGQAVLDTFHFELAAVPVYAGQWLPIEQTYAARRSEVQVRMRSVRVLPTTTEVLACYDYPTASTWVIENATVQIGSGPEVGVSTYQELSEITDDHCVRLGFATADPGSEKMLVFRVHSLAVPAQSNGAPDETVTGPWEFYADIPAEEIVPGQAPVPTATPAALGEETIEDVSVTLDWIFADVKRVAFGYTITGLPDVPNAPYLAGFLQVKDSQGNSLSSMGGGDSTVEHVPDQPGTFTGTWSTVLTEPLQPGEMTLSIDLTLDGSGGADWNNVLAFITQPADAIALEPGVVPPVLPDRIVGTFHFDAQTTVYPGQTVEPKQTVEANGITMRLERAEITPSYANFTLCYNKPSAADWGVGAAPVLNAGDYEAQVRGYSLLADADYGGYLGDPAQAGSAPQIAAGERCIKIEFMLGHSGPSESLVLTIPMLEQSMPEAIPDAELKAAQAKLKAQGIEVDYTVTSSAGGGGGGGPIFTKLPDGINNQQAFQRLMEALGYFHQGPWVFEIDVP